MPAAVVSRPHREIKRTLEIANVKKRIAGIGSHEVSGAPEELATFIKKEIATWAKVMKTAGIRTD